MRPIRLVMQAFGPYAGREVVDFEDAVAAGLFGIYGQTGAGKSTIFSAITFALFGTATKEEQATASLRSDHASAADLTFVEFVFGLGDRRYMIVRRPDQPRPKRRGEGETWETHEAHLFDVTGLSLEDIDNGDHGVVLAEKKTGLVQAAVTELLGYGPRQFRQIVLLPQGRFETFLAANTRDRLEILRDLFDVSLYRRLTARLKADAEEAEKAVKTQRDACAERLRMEGFESTDALKTGAADAGVRHAERHDAETALLEEEKAALAALALARELDARFAAVETATLHRDELMATKADIDELAGRIALAEAARGALDREAAIVETAGESTRAEAARETAGLEAGRAETRGRAALEELDREIARADEVEAVQRAIGDLQRHQQTIAGSADALRAFEDVRSAAREAGTARVAAETALVELHRDRTQASDSLRIAREIGDRRHALDLALSSSLASLKIAQAYERAEADLQIAERRSVELDAGRDAASAEAEVAKQAFEEAEARLSEMQALHLASKLTAGEPCPVCGATHHPSPAMGSAEQIGLDRAFREAKVGWQAKDKVAREAAEACTAASGALGERRRTFAALERAAHTAQELLRDSEDRRRELAELGEPIDLKRLESDLSVFEDRIGAAEKDRDTRREAASAADTAVATANARLEQMLASVPEPLRDAEQIRKALDEKRHMFDERREARARAEAAEKHARETALSASKDLEAAEAALAGARERHEKARLAFETRLLEVGLTSEQFEDLKPTIQKIEADRATVEDHRAKLAGAQERLRQCLAAIEGETRPVIAVLEEAAALSTRIARAVGDERAAARARLDHLDKLSADLSEIFRQLDEAEAATGPLRLLATQFDAGNVHKLDLETYAIGAMFDAVLDAANLRAGPMTGGRYRLEREAEVGGRGRKGLGIQVFDAYTGKPRPASTLSGGETFIAALALALGLADVVESASGKVRLDTVFIDEGFGSLDAEGGTGTLDLVLQVLGGLTSVNRAVGLISHVPLVQEAIPNGFYVTKSGAGSAIETRRRM